jgi:hypothetical protein
MPRRKQQSSMEAAAGQGGGGSVNLSDASCTLAGRASTITVVGTQKGGHDPFEEFAMDAALSSGAR